MPFSPVPFDPEVEAAIAELPAVDGPFTADGIPAMREGMAAMLQPTADVVGDHPVDWVERPIPGPAGAPELTVTIFTPRGLDHPCPGCTTSTAAG